MGPGVAVRPESRRIARERAILRAVIEELARADYGGLTFERVAARAGVNKTTLYRRWPTKAELVGGALASVAQWVRPGTTTGSLRGDLRRIGAIVAAFSTSFEGQCLVRLRLLQHPEPKLARMAKELHARNLADLGQLAQAALARGEVGTDVDFGLLLDMLAGAIHVRLVMKNEPVDDVVIAQIVDVLLDGAARPGRAAQRSVARTSRPRRRPR